MKRLLAYLIVVLGLGLTFNVSANSAQDQLSNTVWKLNSSGNHIVFLENSTCLYTMNITALINKAYYNESSCTWKNIRGKKYSIKINKSIYEIKIKKNSFKGKSGSGYARTISGKKKILISKSKIAKIKFLKTETQITKKETTDAPKKKIEIAKVKNSVDSNKFLVIHISGYGSDEYVSFIGYDENKNKAIQLSKEKCEKNRVSSKRTYDCRDYFYFYNNDYYYKNTGSSVKKDKLVTSFLNPLYKEEFVKAFKIINNQKTQIAKAEPSQTQKVAKKEVRQISLNEVQNLYNQIVSCWSVPLGLPYNADLKVKVKLKLRDDGTIIKTELVDHARMNNPGQAYFKVLAESVLRAIKNCQPLDLPRESYESWKDMVLNFDAEKMIGGDYSGDLQIAEKEPTVKPKKKTKVAKVEPKQEEFKPKKTNQDNEAPIIEIAEAITVNDTDYEFQGKVTDKAKTIYVEIDGRPTDVKNGKFTVKGYSPIDKQISIEAIDQWGNRSKPKIVKLTIDIKDTSIAEKLEPLNPSKIRSKSSNNKVALIIGIENYLESPNAIYANLDAKYFFDYARKGFGVKKQNINLLVDEQATFVKTNKVLTKWLRSKIKSGETELIIFFAGHGLASNDGKELYLLPQDSDPDLLARTALSRTELFKEIIALNPKNVTMFLDTCYSGVSREEKTLLASARPVRIVADEQDTPDNFTIFSASQLDQISSGFKEAKHGIFSYYLMKGLEGKADANKDKDITNGELLAYMDENVAQKASELGRQQNPSLAGDPDKILMSYR